MTNTSAMASRTTSTSSRGACQRCSWPSSSSFIDSKVKATRTATPSATTKRSGPRLISSSQSRKTAKPLAMPNTPVSAQRQSEGQGGSVRPISSRTLDTVRVLGTGQHRGERLGQALQLRVAHGRGEAAEAGDRHQHAALHEAADQPLEARLLLGRGARAAVVGQLAIGRVHAEERAQAGHRAGDTRALEAGLE